MAFNGQKSPLASRLAIAELTKKSHESNNQQIKSQVNQSLIKHHSSLFKSLIVVSILSILPLNSNGLTYDDNFFERLPQQSIASIGTEDANEYEDGLQVYTSQEFTRSCFTKINYKQMCIEYGPNCEFKFEWSYPESLLEQIKKGFDPRIRVHDDLPTSLASNPDYQIYASHLMIANTGYAHRGIWSCNFKFINNDNGKIDSWQHSFVIDIIENGARGSACSTNDHCSSNICKNDQCVCDADAPILVGDLCKKAPKLGENCAVDGDCQINIEDAKCLCTNPSNESLVTTFEDCSNLGQCQCPPSYIAVNLGLGSYRCLKKARINEHCYRSQQCEAIDSSTYCSFKNRCTCRSGATCLQPSIKLCNTKLDCNSINEYCGNGRCQTVKDLNEACTSSDECDPNAQCPPARSVCVCSPGYKVSPAKMICIPKEYCYTDLDCEHGFCSDNSTCIQGVPLLGQCYTTKQCQAYDENSYCDDETHKCTCGPGYFKSSDGSCLLEGKCYVNADCGQDKNGLCYYNECVYLKKLHSYCKESKQCFLSTRYSSCDQSECTCLNGPEKDEDTCPKYKQCQDNSDCSNIINSHCNREKLVCTCDADHTLNIDGYCYKKALSPASDRDAFWIKLWNDYYIYIIVGAAVSGFLLSVIICSCCKLCCPSKPSRPSGRTGRTRGGFDKPVSGVYITNPPSAPPPPYQPSTISRNF